MFSESYDWHSSDPTLPSYKDPAAPLSPYEHVRLHQMSPFWFTTDAEVPKQDDDGPDFLFSRHQMRLQSPQSSLQSVSPLSPRDILDLDAVAESGEVREDPAEVDYNLIAALYQNGDQNCTSTQEATEENQNQDNTDWVEEDYLTSGRFGIQGNSSFVIHKQDAHYRGFDMSCYQLDSHSLSNDNENDHDLGDSDNNSSDDNDGSHNSETEDKGDGNSGDEDDEANWCDDLAVEGVTGEENMDDEKYVVPFHVHNSSHVEIDKWIHLVENSTELEHDHQDFHEGDFNAMDDGNDDPNDADYNDNESSGGSDITDVEDKLRHDGESEHENLDDNMGKEDHDKFGDKKKEYDDENSDHIYDLDNEGRAPSPMGYEAFEAMLNVNSGTGFQSVATVPESPVVTQQAPITVSKLVTTSATASMTGITHLPAAITAHSEAALASAPQVVSAAQSQAKTTAQSQAVDWSQLNPSTPGWQPPPNTFFHDSGCWITPDHAFRIDEAVASVAALNADFTVRSDVAAVYPSGNNKGKWNTKEYDIAITSMNSILQGIEANTMKLTVQKITNMIVEELETYGYNRRGDAVRNQYNRSIRAECGLDERKVKRPYLLVSGELGPRKAPGTKSNRLVSTNKVHKGAKQNGRQFSSQASSIFESMTATGTTQSDNDVEMIDPDTSLDGMDNHNIAIRDFDYDDDIMMYPI